MATEDQTTVEEQSQEVQKEEKEPLFSKKNKKLITDPLDDNNPITIQVLGICSALAVTTQLKPSMVMGLSVIFVMISANMIISALRNAIPSRIRIIVQLVVISSLVVLVDQFLAAFMYDVSKQLSVFVGLIITNCIIMGRLEAFALGNKVWPSALDGFGNAIGYGVILVMVGFVRELFGSGSILGFNVFPQFLYEAGYMNNNLFVLPPMALITVGIIIWIQRYRNQDLIEET
ncbi:MAG: NADH:ubiquinone reductase (Na(+)-transporting) subunit D [Flavobacteriales bacterium]